MNQQDRQVDVDTSATAAADGDTTMPTGEHPFADEKGADVSETIDELQTLRVELQKAQAKADENWSLFLGARAEADNIKKRAERDVQNAHKYGLEKLIGELLPVKDSLELGISAANDTSEVEKIKEGSELTLKMLNTVIEKFGVQEIDPLGSKFNPDLHEAMAMQPTKDAEPNTVLQVIQKGYVLNERLVRPALVIVARAG